MTCRVVYKPDGQISVLSVSPDAGWLPKETAAARDERILSMSMMALGFEGLDYDDIDNSQLPQDRASRDKWRGNKSTGIQVDHNIVTNDEKRAAIEQELEALTAKPNPTQAEVMNAIGLQRKLANNEV